MKNKIISDVLFKVLRILVRVVTEDIPDCYGKPGTSFQKKLQELFGRITSKVNNACQSDMLFWVTHFCFNPYPTEFVSHVFKHILSKKFPLGP